MDFLPDLCFQGGLLVFVIGAVLYDRRRRRPANH